MKNSIISLFFYFICLCFLNFSFRDDFTEFGISKGEVAEKLLSGLQNSRTNLPYFSSSVKSSCQSILPENQAFAIRKIGGLIKSYYASDEFRILYAEWVTRKFPQNAVTISEERKNEIKERKLKEVRNITPKDIEPTIELMIQTSETFAGMGKIMPSLPADQREEFKKQVDDGKRNAVFYKKIKPLIKSDFAAFKNLYAAHLTQEQIVQEESSLLKNNKNNLLELEKWKDPKKILHGKLSLFLEKTEGVDFDAQTKSVNNRKRFVNTSYEGQNSLWKFCYRMGKTPTNAARAYAKQWLTELK